ncbi:MAG: glycine cleavage system protein T [Alphaproteobacteria bacterium]|nr:MAG: glycine cleavage system protein T [Alphaproteobacteria bacterium]
MPNPPEAVFFLPQSRGVIAVEGPDSREFLQGLISNDVRRVTEEQAIYAALLTPQGRYLHDFFVAVVGDTLLLDCEAVRRDDLKRRLSIYRLRSKVTLADATDRLAVALVFGGNALERLGLPGEPGRARRLGDGLVYVDPRLPGLGARALLPHDAAADLLSEAGLVPGEQDRYDRLRLRLGVPDGSRDLPIEKAILLENGFDELHGVDWQKGCYIGQELTARTKYRGLVRKRLLPVEIEGPAPEPGTKLMLGDQEVGEMRSAVDGLGLAMIRLEHFEKASADGATAGAARVKPRRPDWASF